MIWIRRQEPGDSVPSNNFGSSWWQRVLGFNRNNNEEASASSETTSRIQRVIRAPQSFQVASDDNGPQTAQVEERDQSPVTKELWGRNFTVPSYENLLASEVIPFVEELLSRNKELEQNDSPTVMTNYVQKLMGELQQVEESIKNQARRDAEAEAARITTEARRQAGEMITNARREAASMASQEAESMLAGARKKVEIVEGQLRLHAQLMLAKAREQVEEHIRRESRGAYDRVLASLSAVMEEAQRVELDWKTQTSSLWRADEVKASINELGFSALPIINETLGDSLPDPEPVDGEEDSSNRSEGNTRSEDSESGHG
jgi:cell division septum initiation protein DivIVA